MKQPKKIKIQKDFEVPVKGVHVVSFFDMRSEWAYQIDQRIAELTVLRENALNKVMRGEMLWSEFRQLTERIRGEYFDLKDKLLMKKLTRQYCVENITVTSGRALIAQFIANDHAGAVGTNYCEVGDDNTSEVVGNTALGNATTRKALSDGNTNSNQALLETFFNTSEAVDTHEEFGFWMNGNATIGTGTLLNRFTQTVVKAGTESMNVQSTITVNDA